MSAAETSIEALRSRLRSAATEVRRDGADARGRLAAQAGHARHDLLTLSVDPTGRIVSIDHAAAVLTGTPTRWAAALISAYRDALTSAWQQVGSVADPDLRAPAGASGAALDRAADRQRQVADALAGNRHSAESDGVRIEVDGRGQLAGATIDADSLAALGQRGLDRAVLMAFAEASALARRALGADLRVGA